MCTQSHDCDVLFLSFHSKLHLHSFQSKRCALSNLHKTTLHGTEDTFCRNYPLITGIVILTGYEPKSLSSPLIRLDYLVDHHRPASAVFITSTVLNLNL